MDEGVGVGVNNSRSKVGRQAGTNEVCHCPVVSTAWSVCSCIALAVKVLDWCVYTCLCFIFDGNECGRMVGVDLRMGLYVRNVGRKDSEQ